MTSYYCKADVLSGGDIENKDNPCSVAEAFKDTSPVSGGDTLYIRGGLLRSCSTVFARDGEPGNPIYVQPMPGERFILDSYVPFPIHALSAGAGEIRYAGAIPSGLVTGKEILMEVNTPRAEIAQKSTGTSGGSMVNRGWSSTVAVDHPEGAECYQSGHTLKFLGSHIRFSFTAPETPQLRSKLICSNPIRTFYDWPTGNKNQPSVQYSGDGINIIDDSGRFPTDIHIINAWIEDCGEGFYIQVSKGDIWMIAPLVVNVGHVDSGIRGHGHASYIHSTADAPIEVRGGLAVNGFAAGYTCKGVNDVIKNCYFKQLICVNNGAPAAYDGNPANLGRYARMTQVGLGSSDNAAPENVNIYDSTLWAPMVETPAANSEPTIEIGHTAGYPLSQNPQGCMTQVNHNDIIGGYNPVQFCGSATAAQGGWWIAEFQWNSVVTKCKEAGTMLKLVTHEDADVSRYIFGNNDYHCAPPGQVYCCSWTSSVKHPNGQGGGNLKWDKDPQNDVKDFVGYGLKHNQAWENGSKFDTLIPSAVKLKWNSFPEIPNQFHVHVINLGEKPAVVLPAANFVTLGVEIGDTIQLHSSLDYENDIEEHVFDGTDIEYVMTPSSAGGPRTVKRPNGFTNENYHETSCPQVIGIVGYRIPFSGTPEPPEPTPEPHCPECGRVIPVTCHTCGQTIPGK